MRERARKAQAAKKEEIIENVKKYVSYGYHGGGRKATGIKRVSICISGQPEQIEELKEMAAQTHRLSGQQRGANNLQGLVFGALRCDVTFKAVTTFNQK